MSIIFFGSSLLLAKLRKKCMCHFNLKSLLMKCTWVVWLTVYRNFSVFAVWPAFKIFKYIWLL